MGKLKQFWVGVGITLGTLAAAVAIWWLRNKFLEDARQDTDIKERINEGYEQYQKAVKDKADELAALKADEVVSAFHKAFGGKS